MSAALAVVEPFDDELEAGLVERLALRIFRLGDAVAVQHEHLARLERRVDGAELRSLEHAERDAGAGQPLEPCRRGGGAAAASARR